MVRIVEAYQAMLVSVTALGARNQRLSKAPCYSCRATAKPFKAMAQPHRPMPDGRTY